MKVCWFNVYPNFWGSGIFYSTAHNSRDDADMYANGRRLYCIKVMCK